MGVGQDLGFSLFMRNCCEIEEELGVAGGASLDLLDVGGQCVALQPYPCRPALSRVCMMMAVGGSG